MGVNSGQPFCLRKRRFSIFRALFLTAYFLLSAFYTYHGLQPYSADTSAEVRLEIPSINLATPVDSVTKTDAKLDVPEIIAGAYSEHPNKTLLVGHSNTVFQGLKNLDLSTTIIFDQKAYQVIDITTKAKEDIDMSEILGPETNDTIILMTCAGQHIKGHDYTHRLIITAKITD